MPVIVIGADTEIGEAIVEALLPRRGEVRAFVSDPDAAARLKERGVKVAVGDVSDASHVGGAALNTFSAVLVPEAATDARERSFAAGASQVFAMWAEALGDAGVHRAIWLAAEDLESLPIATAPEVAIVATAGRAHADVAADVASLDEAAVL